VALPLIPAGGHRWFQACLLVGFGLVLSVPAFGQLQPLRIFHVDNPNGSVSVLAENHGYIPYTVDFRADLVHMQSSVALPAKIVVFPSREPRVLATFVPAPGQPYSYRYHTPYQIGIYSDKAQATSMACPFA
jgi:hypothetical protein